MCASQTTASLTEVGYGNPGKRLIATCKIAVRELPGQQKNGTQAIARYVHEMEVLNEETEI